MTRSARTASFVKRACARAAGFAVGRGRAPRQRREWTRADLANLRLEGLRHLSHLLSGEATREDAAALQRWRGRSTAHEEAFRSAVRLRRLVRRLLTGAPLINR